MDPISWIIWYVIVPMAIATAVAYYTAPKPKRLEAAGKDEFKLPTAEEGRPLPVLSGCRRILSPNAISPLLDYYVRRSGSSERRNTFYYNIGFHAALCHANIDGILQFWSGETCMWPTVNDSTVRASDGETLADINAWDIYGGYERGGGVDGPVHIQYGGDAQTLDSYLESKLGANQPAYRGFTGFILAFVGIGTQPVLQPWSALAKRTQKHTDGSEIWYIAKAAVGSDGDLNAIHFVYERLVCPITGMGKPASLIGSSFTSAADTCYTEGYGISNVWDSAGDSIDSLISRIEEIVEGKLYTDPETGKFEFGLIRDDYNPATLEEFDEDDFWIEDCSARSAGIVPSKVIVKWHDRTNLQSRPSQDDDIALLARQDGRTLIMEFDYSAFVCSPTLANQIAARKQRTFSAMPKRYTLHALRTMSHLHETSVIKIIYSNLNIASMIVRVLSIDRGSLANGECIIEVVEDVFGQAYTVYGTPPDSAAAPAEEVLDESATEEVVILRTGEIVYDRLSSEVVYTRWNDNE